MSAAALLLAVGLLLGPGTAVVRGRAGLRTARPRRGAPSASNPTDPLATASTLDVLSVCLSAGMSVPAAAAATSSSAPPGLAALLRRAADLLALGAEPDTAWAAGRRCGRCQRGAGPAGTQVGGVG